MLMKLMNWFRQLFGTENAGSEEFKVVESQYHIHTQEKIPVYKKE